MDFLLIGSLYSLLVVIASLNLSMINDTDKCVYDLYKVFVVTDDHLVVLVVDNPFLMHSRRPRGSPSPELVRRGSEEVPLHHLHRRNRRHR